MRLLLWALTKNSPARATAPHVSLIGHITADELRRHLTLTESANGYGNRHLWICTDRSKLLPEGGQVDPVAWDTLRADLVEAIAFAGDVGPVSWDDEARAIWCNVYGTLSEGRAGLAGALLGRAAVLGESDGAPIACHGAPALLARLGRWGWRPPGRLADVEALAMRCGQPGECVSLDALVLRHLHRRLPPVVPLTDPLTVAVLAPIAARAAAVRELYDEFHR